MPNFELYISAAGLSDMDSKILFERHTIIAFSLHTRKLNIGAWTWEKELEIKGSRNLNENII